MIQSDGERQAPLSIEGAEPSHLIRYLNAMQYVEPHHIVVDAPCGTGYGTALLASTGAQTYGIDLSPDAIQHANEFFKRATNEFYVGNIETMGELFDDASIDRLVSFEGIEHLRHPEKFLSEAKRIVKPEGYMILSTPRKPHGSPYHIKEYSLDEFKEELSAFFRIKEMFGQVYTDIRPMEENTDPQVYRRFNFIALCTPL